MSLIVTVTTWQFNPFCFEVCSNDLALAVRFCADVSVSDNLLLTIGICCASSLMYLKTAALGCVTDNVIVFCSFRKILLLEVFHHFYSNTLQ